MIDIDKFGKEFFKAPKPPPEWERVYRAMIVHTRGVKPTELLELKRPNEPKDINTYRLANYKPITKNGINQAIDSVFRILLGSNYSIVPSSNIADYIEETEFSFFGEQLTFDQVFFRHILRVMFDDPNGLLVWLPQNPEDKALSPLLTPEGEKVNVIPVYVPSSHIRVFTSDIIAYEAEDKWLVDVPGGPGQPTKKQPEPYYFFLTHDFIYRFLPEWSQAEKKVVYRVHPYYNLSRTEDEEGSFVDPDKEFETLVAHQLGGNIALNEKGKRYYDSFFGGYVPFGDDAITAYSDNQAVRVRYNFPYVSIKGQLCVSCKGAGKVLSKDKETAGYKITCEKCNGSGKVIPFTPFGHYMKEPPAATDNEAFTSSPAVEFYSPDVSILQHSYDVWKDLLDQAKEAVNLVFTKEAQSGVAKEIDREQKYEMLIKIANNFFELIQWSLDTIESYKEPFVSDRKENIVRTPGSFAVKTAGQLTEELTDLTAKEAPQSYIATTANRLAMKVYKDDAEAQRIIEVLTVWDALFGKSSQQIASLKASGGATSEDVRKHTHGYSILARIANEEDIEQMDLDAIIELADEKLKEMATENILRDDSGNEIRGGGDDGELGKIPLATQQLALARERALSAGDTKLADEIGKKIDDLLNEI